MLQCPTESYWQRLQEIPGSASVSFDALKERTQSYLRKVNLQDALGRVAPGFRADLLVVDAKLENPLESLPPVRAVLVDGVLQHPTSVNFGTYVAYLFSSWLKI